MTHGKRLAHTSRTEVGDVNPQRRSVKLEARWFYFTSVVRGCRIGFVSDAAFYY